MREQKQQPIKHNLLRSIGVPLAAIASLAVLTACGDTKADAQPGNTTPAATASPNNTPSASPTETLEPVSDEIVNLTGFENSNQALEAGEEVQNLLPDTNSWKNSITELYEAVKSDDIEAFVKKYNIDKKEVEANITALTSILDTYGSRIDSLDASDEEIMEKYLSVTPKMNITLFRSTLFLLAQLREHPQYSSVVPTETVPPYEANSTQMAGAVLGIGYVTKEFIYSKPSDQAAKDNLAYIAPSNGKASGYVTEMNILSAQFVTDGMSKEKADTIVNMTKDIDTLRVKSSR